MKILKKNALLLIIMYGLPINILAHGTEEEHQQENLLFEKLIDGGLIVSILLFITSMVCMFFISKKLKTVDGKSQQGKQRRTQLKKTSTILIGVSIVTLASTVILGFITVNKEESNQGSGMELMHIHGLGHTKDGQSFYIPVHEGLRVFTDGAWKNPVGEKHDYMGFSMVDNGFYSSGHPAVGSNLENPFGIIKSNDLGNSLEILDLYKEVDFHGMAVGYYSHAIYVLNPQPNSRMEDIGLYYSVNDTKTWTKSEMTGLEGQAAAIAVHQEDQNIVAIGTNQGAFLSTDHGNNFESIVANVPTSAVHFTNDNQLLIGGFENGSVLIEMDLSTKEKNLIPLPNLSKEDAITYISVNPQNSSEIVITMYENNIFLTKDSGTNWTQIAKEGTTIDIAK